jgi:hypothetical protein
MRYEVKFSDEAKEYRISILSLLDGVTIEELPDDKVCITCDEATAEVIEYELRKADRRDDRGCKWRKI